MRPRRSLPRRWRRSDSHVRRVPMACVEWVPGSASLEVGGRASAVHVGPYSLPCDLEAPLVAVSSIEELESEAVRGAVVLLHGAIAAGQVMPRNFTFYNPESHRRVYRALDTFAPAPIVAATGRDPEMVGSQYPFPLFEDGDLDIPNAYITDVEGAQLVALGATRARLRIASQRLPATGRARGGHAPGHRERPHRSHRSHRQPARFARRARQRHRGGHAARGRAAAVAGLRRRGHRRVRAVQRRGRLRQPRRAAMDRRERRPLRRDRARHQHRRFKSAWCGQSRLVLRLPGRGRGCGAFGHGAVLRDRRRAAVVPGRPRHPRHLRASGHRDRLGRDDVVHGELRAHRARRA